MRLSHELCRRSLQTAAATAGSGDGGGGVGGCHTGDGARTQEAANFPVSSLTHLSLSPRMHNRDHNGQS